MRICGLLALMIMGCDNKPDEPEQTTDDEPVEDTLDDTEPVDDTDTPADDTASTGETGTPGDDTGVIPDEGPCAGKIVGVMPGECAADFALTDQNGATHQLWDYAGQVLLLDFSGFT